MTFNTMKTAKQYVLKEIMATALSATKRAQTVMLDGLKSGDLGLRNKAGLELVTRFDIETEQAIIKEIKRKYPTHQILSEESATDFDLDTLAQGPLWIIDPIDGTTNYAHGHKQFASSIAFADEGTILAAAVNSPLQSELFTATKHQGAFLNGEPIKTGNQKELKKALIGTGFPYKKTYMPEIIERLSRVLRTCPDIRRIGAASLDICWTACGRLDGFYESLSVWDFAAASLIAREAGAIIGNFGPQDGTSTYPELNGKNLVVANPLLYASLKILLEEN
jgi:myo-inositol-1(or 4)-monophosphatase